MEGQYIGYQLHSAAGQNPQNENFSRGAKNYFMFFFCNAYCYPKFRGRYSAYILEGGIGQRRVAIEVEATFTMYVNYASQIYGTN
jgi:hypothetical protein